MVAAAQMGVAGVCPRCEAAIARSSALFSMLEKITLVFRSGK